MSFTFDTTIKQRLRSGCLVSYIYVQKPEITAPVANFEMCLAAVHNGADAVYLGMPGFNARARANQFDLEELQRIIEYCRLYGVKTAVCANILAYDSELELLIERFLEVLKLEPDHLVVQDIGVARLLHFLAPAQAISASTQMSITDSGGIRATENLGLTRYILARELPLKELEKIKETASTELEVFVHGALCVSYSGQCLSSESHGGRSANRGECAQCCRLPYEVFVDGEKLDVAGRNYVLSPKDLGTLEVLPQLVEIGIKALKIEGRLKTPEYVAAVVKAYRSAVDKKLSQEEVENFKKNISLIFSRGMCTGFLQGERHKELVTGYASGNQGLKAGRVLDVKGGRVKVKSLVALKTGYGVLITDDKQKRRAAGNVYAVKAGGEKDSYWLELGRGFEAAAVRRGDPFFVNAAPDLERELKRSFADKEKLRRVPVKGTVSGRTGFSLTLTLTDDEGRSVVLASETALEQAKKAALTEAAVKEELAALGGSCFKLEEFDWQVQGDLFLHKKAIKQLRQKAVKELEGRRLSLKGRPLKSTKDALGWICEEKGRALGGVKTGGRAERFKLSVLLRRPEQIEALAGIDITGRVYLDFKKPKIYREALQELASLGLRGAVATTRVQREGERGILKTILDAGPEAVLVRNLSALNFFRSAGGIQIIADTSLNVANSLSAGWLLGEGVQLVTPCHDLDASQLTDLARAIGGAALEVCLSHHMPLFHTQHCLYAALLGAGNCYPECERPCARHRLELLDPYGVRGVVELDAGRRNTIYKKEPDEGVLPLDKLYQIGVRNFRVEVLDATAEELREKLKRITLELKRVADRGHAHFPKTN